MGPGPFFNRCQLSWCHLFRKHMSRWHLFIMAKSQLLLTQFWPKFWDPPKIFEPQIFFIGIFSYLHFFDPKFFFGHNNFLAQILFLHKFFWTKISLDKNFFHPKSFFFHQNFFNKSFILNQKFFWPLFLGPTIFFRPTNFSSYYSTFTFY